MSRVRYSIRCLSSREYDQLLFKSMLAIFGHRSADEPEWVYQEDGDVDAVVLDYDAPLPTLTSQAVVIGYSDEEANLVDVTFKLTKPLRARQLLSVLADIEQQLTGQTPLPSNSSPFAQPLPEVLAEPVLAVNTATLDWLYHLIRQHPQAVLALTTTQGQVYIDTKKQTVSADYLYEQQRIDWLSTHATELESVPLSAWHITSLSELFYQLSVQDRPVRLLSPLTPNHYFQLRQWPTFANKPDKPMLTKIAAYFARRRSNLAIAAMDLSVSMEQLVSFINAAHGQNLLVFDTGSPEPIAESLSTPTEPPAMTGLFQRIRRKFGMN